MNNTVVEQIAEFYAEAFRAFDKKRPSPEIHVSFYPYIDINHTIRIRDGRVFVRLAEICHDLPLGAQRALAFILVARLLRKKVPAAARQIYSNSIKTKEITDRATENKRARGRKVITRSMGEIYNLDEIFCEVNRLYFQNAVPKPTLTWSARKTYSILGHHDDTHKTVVVSKSLDHRRVPRFIVEYVLFHEMLHILHPAENRNGRRYHHTPAFRRAERKFSRYNEAERWIKENVRLLKRRAKGKK